MSIKEQIKKVLDNDEKREILSSCMSIDEFYEKSKNQLTNVSLNEFENGVFEVLEEMNPGKSIDLENLGTGISIGSIYIK